MASQVRGRDKVSPSLSLTPPKVVTLTDKAL